MPNTFIQRKCNLLLEVRSPDTSRFPQAAGEPPRAGALRGLTYAFPPAGVSRCLDCSEKRPSLEHYFSF